MNFKYNFFSSRVYHLNSNAKAMPQYQIDVYRALEDATVLKIVQRVTTNRTVHRKHAHQITLVIVNYIYFKTSLIKIFFLNSSIAITGIVFRTRGFAIMMPIAVIVLMRLKSAKIGNVAPIPSGIFML